jgi:hypothetical protein
MTIPETPRDALASDGAAERITRPEPEAGGPNRAGASNPAKDAADLDPSVSEAIAHAVRSGYEVIAENIRQGREAAAKFRQGDYNMRDVPGDVETALLRAIQLARELSTTALDVCERLVKDLGPQDPPDGRVNPPPPFWPTPKPAAAPGPGAGSPPDRIALTVRFKAGAKAEARTQSLDRPRRPTPPQDVFATPLQSRDAAQGSIVDVAFSVDISIAGLVAEVALPDGLAAGVYSGLVYARNEEVPLGALAIEILP